MQRIEIDHDFKLPVERVYAFLAEHDNLGPIFAPFKVRHLTDGETTRSGVGSARKLTIAGQAPVVETVTEAVPNERIVYGITKGSPLKNHRGVMEFSSTPTGSRLHYVIEFGSKIPGVDIAAAKILSLGIRRGLAKVDDLA
jgi:uncharacterized protein YndB with AHSA1/START domain